MLLQRLVIKKKPCFSFFRILFQKSKLIEQKVLSLSIQVHLAAFTYLAILMQEPASWCANVPPDRSGHARGNTIAALMMSVVQEALHLSLSRSQTRRLIPLSCLCVQPDLGHGLLSWADWKRGGRFSRSKTPKATPLKLTDWICCIPFVITVHGQKC